MSLYFNKFTNTSPPNSSFIIITKLNQIMTKLTTMLKAVPCPSILFLVCFDIFLLKFSGLTFQYFPPDCSQGIIIVMPLDFVFVLELHLKPSEKSRAKKKMIAMNIIKSTRPLPKSCLSIFTLGVIPRLSVKLTTYQRPDIITKTSKLTVTAIVGISTFIDMPARFSFSNHFITFPTCPKKFLCFYS